MNKIRILICIVILFILYSNSFAGFVDTPQNIKLIQPESNIYLEVGKWVGGVVTVSFAAWFTYYLNKKKKKND